MARTGALKDERHSRTVRDDPREAAQEIYRRLYEIWQPATPPEPLDPSTVARLLNVRYHEPAEILSLVKDSAEVAYPVRFAGYMDPAANAVGVAQGLSPEVARFTAAHELGHFVLHRERGRLFRDLPRSDHELTNGGCAPEEEEADLFAAELLMPEEILRRVFASYFHRETFHGVKPDEEMVYWLSRPYSKVTPAKLADRGPRYVSLLFANSPPWRAEGGPSLAQLFRVSMLVMAVQLENLQLV